MVTPSSWTSKLSQRRIADYKPFMMVDGEGVRCSVYVSGCPFACKGCFNQAAWSFKYGEEFSEDLLERIMRDLRHEYVQGLSLLGGEPFLNTQVCLTLAEKVRAEFGDAKDIWCWSGYSFEELTSLNPSEHADKTALLNLVDVLVDGRFILEERDLTLAFRGSRNQRVLDVKASLEQSQAVMKFN